MSVDDDSSDLSSLSSLSPAPSDIELDAPADLEAPKSKPKKGIQKYFSTVAEQPPKEPTPPPRRRSPSPPHEYVLADNPDIAVCARISIFIHFPKGNGLARVATFATRPGRVLYLTSRVLANKCAVHCNVQKPLPRRISQIPCPLWPSGARARCCRSHSRRPSRTLPLRVAGVTLESQAGCQVRPPLSPR